MDYIESLAKQASQLTVYDVKSYYNQAKNMVLNVSEMEAKVREATNDDPWGASSTLMQQIADGTNNFAQFNEIMPCIYSRFMEKEAREWRQIYKALTLLEFLVKNGSERVVDDARAHVSTIKMLRSFHYVDEKGKDQGINVRNRSSEIALLLGDVEKIRQERRKAKSNKTKYQGQGNDGGMSFVTAGGSRYGGFGSESVEAGGRSGGSRYGSSSGGGYDNGDEYRSSSRGFADRQGQAAVEYDEYEGADDFNDQPRRTTSATSSRTSRPNPPPKSAPKAQPKPVEKPKEVNLFDFDDDDTPASAPAAALAAPAVGGDDDFDDFQSAPSIPTSAAPTPAPKAATANGNLFDLLNSNPSVPAPAQTQNRAPSLATPLQPPTYSGITPSQPSITSRPSYASKTTTSSTPAALSPKPTGGASTFDDLWTSSLSTLGSGATKPTSTATAGKSINEMEKEKAMNKLWGPTPSSQPFGQNQAQAPAQSQAKPAGGGGFDDLLL